MENNNNANGSGSTGILKKKDEVDTIRDVIIEEIEKEEEKKVQKEIIDGIRCPNCRKKKPCNCNDPDGFGSGLSEKEVIE